MEPLEKWRCDERERKFLAPRHVMKTVPDGFYKGCFLFGGCLGFPDQVCSQEGTGR